MALLSITILTLDAKDVPVLGSVRSGMMQVVEPVTEGASSIGTPFRNAWNGITGYDDLEQENAELRRRLDELEGNILINVDNAAQIEKLREQLGLPFISAIETIPAQIATGNFSSFDDHTARLDVGSDAGVAAEMPVVTAAGLIGYIASVSPGTSVVRLITDPDVRVGIRLKSNNLGVGHGTGSRKPFLIDQGIGLDDEVEVGDPVTTSGLERAKFPRNLPIGQVAKVDRNQGDQTQILSIDLAADLSRLDFVQVLKWTPSAGDDGNE